MRRGSFSGPRGRVEDILGRLVDQLRTQASDTPNTEIGKVDLELGDIPRRGPDGRNAGGVIHPETAVVGVVGWGGIANPLFGRHGRTPCRTLMSGHNSRRDHPLEKLKSIREGQWKRRLIKRKKNSLVLGSDIALREW